MKPGKIFAATFITLAMVTSMATAGSVEEYKPKMRLGDGKDGRVWGQWQQSTKDESVREVRAKVSRRSGGNDTYLNLRFGKKGKTFENGKRVYLVDNKVHTVKWNVGQSPNGQPLIMNAYNGEVQLEYITVRR